MLCCVSLMFFPVCLFHKPTEKCMAKTGVLTRAAFHLDDDQVLASHVEANNKDTQRFRMEI